jgi:hypothetical protein
VEIIFEPRDFDADFDRGANASTNLTQMFQDIVGCDHIIGKLGDYQQIAVVTKERGMDARLLIPMCFVFKGPPVRMFWVFALSAADLLIKGNRKDDHRA